MTENYNFMTLSNRWFELTSDAYRTYLKSILLFQERYIDMTRNMLNQVDTLQSEGRGLVTEISSEIQRTRSLLQDTVQRGIKNSNETISEVALATREGLNDLSQRLDEKPTETESTIVIAHS